MDLCDIVYVGNVTADKSTATATATAGVGAVKAATAAEPPRQQAGGGSRLRRRAAPSAGFRLSLTELEAEDEITDTEELWSFLTNRYGNKAANVLSILRLWEVFGQLYSAWRQEWESDTPAYRALRALRFLRAGISRQPVFQL
eukprot:3944958-Pleurochrysis_carterae.AAC.2